MALCVRPVPMAKPYAYNPPANVWMAREMMSHNIPLNQVQMNGPAGMPGSVTPMTLTPPGMPSIPGAMPGGLANPTAIFLALAMLLYRIGEIAIGQAVKNATLDLLRQGVRTRDLGGPASTEACGKAVMEALG